MSNTICVKRTEKTIETLDYYPFQWINDELYIYDGKNWIAVTATQKKNQYKDRIFVPVQPEKVYTPQEKP